jgi:hypothetical protein
MTRTSPCTWLLAKTIYLDEQHFAEFFLDEWDFIRTHIHHLRGRDGDFSRLRLESRGGERPLDVRLPIPLFFLVTFKQ